MKIRLLLTLAGLGIGFAPPAIAFEGNLAGDVKALDEFTALSMKEGEAFNKNDAAALAALFTEDAVLERRFIFHTSDHGSAEAERFIKLMRRLEAFSGIRVLTYALMSKAASIANTCLPKGAPRAQTNRRPLTWPALSLSLNSRMGNFLCPNACFVGLGTSPTG
jgi:hypothetical protein